MTDATPNVPIASDGEARVRAMTTEVLERNLPACVLAEKQWGEMSRGELEEKPDCPFCIAHPGPCDDCALMVFDEKNENSLCGATFVAWNRIRYKARERAKRCTGGSFKETYRLAMHDITVMAAASEMALLLGRLRAVIEDELGKRAADEADAREAKAWVEPDADDTATFESDLANLLNRYSRENGSNTPDFILAKYLMRCLGVFDEAVIRRAEWYGKGGVK